jgi:HK97 family phage prohead protease
MSVAVFLRRVMTNLIEQSDVVENTDPDFDFKAISGQIGIDKAQGVVEAFVSGIGNKDSVGDVVVSGAFNGSLKRRKPRVVWGHDWNQPIGKVLEIYEVPKSDPRLPDKMKQAGIGGLFAKVQFNLNTERGREAFANVAFYGMDQEWSIGYKTITADFDAGRQANMLKEVELYEMSPVLHGANQLTGTISVKDDSDGTVEKGGVYSMDDDKDAPSNRVDALSAMMGRMLSQALKKPVTIVEINGNSVVFQTGEDMTWMATFTREGDRIMVGKPTRVKPTTSYTPVGDEAPPSMMIKGPDEKDAEEPEGIRDENSEQGTWATPDIALAWSKTFGCSGYHSHGGGYLPCETHEEYEEALEKFDDNANINVHNNYLEGVDVEEAKDAACGCESEKGACACGTEEKGHMMRYQKPDYLKDPMALLLMAYNEMLKIRGAGELREATLSLINEVENFLTEAPMSRSMEQGEKVTSGFIVHVKCSEVESFDVSSAVAQVPVFAFKSEDGVDLHFSAKVEHQELLEKVASALAVLSFEPNISVSKPENLDTAAGVE